MKLIRLAVMAFAAVAGFSARASIASALDCTGRSFTTGGATNWVEQTTDKKVGTSAMRSGAISDSTNTWLQTTVTGAGMVSFWWKVSSESECDCLAVLIDDEEVAQISDDLGWTQKSVVVVGEDEHTVKWMYYKDYSVSEGADCGWLDAVSWTRAPESMTVTFVTNGGGKMAPTNVVPGVRYGELPEPQKEGNEVFGGWYFDEGLTEKVSSSALVEFRNQTLYAKWRLPVSLLNVEGLEFGTDDDPESSSLPWEAVEEAGASGGYAARGPIDPDYQGGYFYLWTTNGAGTLTYKWRIDGTGESGSFYEYSYQGEYYFGEDGEGWKTRTLYLCGDDEEGVELGWYSSGRNAALMLSDFVWTPAPESMRVTFVTNGGDEIAPTNVAPGVTYGELPVPRRDDESEFSGWYLDEGLTERVSIDD